MKPWGFEFYGIMIRREKIELGGEGLERWTIEKGFLLPHWFFHMQ